VNLTLTLTSIKFNYFTDTGRRWNGKKVSVRDRVMSGKPDGRGDKQLSRAAKGESRQNFRSTADIIKAAETGSLPPVVMITLHPQRWDNRLMPWLYELFWQNTKNAVKRFLTAP